MVLFGGHCLCEFIGLCKDVTAFSYAGGKLECGPFFARARALEDIDVEVGEFGIVEIEVGGAVGVIVGKVCAGPVQNGHEVVADCVDSFKAEVPQGLLVDLYLLIAVRASVFDGFHHGKAFHHAPAHAVAFDVLLQLMNLFPCPDLSEGDVVKGCDYSLHPDLSKHGKGDLILLAKPAPCSFHKFEIFIKLRISRGKTKFLARLVLDGYADGRTFQQNSP